MLDSYWIALQDPKDPLLHFRKQGWDRFKEIGLPRSKPEAFQYLSLKNLCFPKLAVRQTHPMQVRSGLVFVDGFFEGAVSQIPEPFICLPLESAMRSYGLFLQNRLARSLKEETDPFVALNGAFQGQGAFLYVPPQCKAALHLTQIFTSVEMANPRIHVYLGRNAKLQLTQTSEGSSGFCNSVLDFVLDEGAELIFQDTQAGHFQAFRVQQKRDSKLKMILLAKSVRTSMKVQLLEENAQAEIFGLAQLKNDEESHAHVTVEHVAPHTRSKQHFKSVLQGKSRFSFEGKIVIRPAAQKTEAYQLTNNLLLSDEATANAKPHLEIFADDVKASHGATVGQLDEEQLFYLRSRGLSLEQAKGWLVDGFCKEILDHAQ